MACCRCKARQYIQHSSLGSLIACVLVPQGAELQQRKVRVQGVEWRNTWSESPAIAQ